MLVYLRSEDIIWCKEGKHCTSIGEDLMSILDKIKTFEDTISITDLRKNLEEVCEKLKKNHEIVITQKQDVIGVLIDKNTYEERKKLMKALQEKLEYYEIGEGILEAKKNSKIYTEKEMREKLKL